MVKRFKSCSSRILFIYLKYYIEDNDDVHMDEDTVVPKLQSAVEEAEELVSNQIKALEILTNVFCCGDDDSEEFYDDETCSEISDNATGLEEISVVLPPSLKKELVDAQLFRLVIEKAKLPAENIVEALKQHRPGWYSNF